MKELENTVEPMAMTYMPFHSFGNHAGGKSSSGMFIAEAGVIRRLAQDGPCVILGRSADYVLADMPNHFAIFVCADDKYRQQRGKDVYEGKTLKELDRENEKRARYYNYYTGRKWGEPANYDLVVNTGRAPLDKIADAIIKYIDTLK
ncbi:cytidylate kinase-like family protein [Megamonas sp.]